MQWWQCLYDIRFKEGWREPEEVTRSQVDFLEAALGLTKETSVLDLACGSGRHLIELAHRGYQDLTGIDYSSLLISEATTLSQKHQLRITLSQGDMRDFDLGRKFGCVTLLDVSFGYFDEGDNEKVIGQVARHLRTGGLVVFHLFNPHNLAGLLGRKWIPWNGEFLLMETAFDPVEAIVAFHTIVVSKGEPRRHPTQKIRVYSLRELVAMASKAGLDLVRVYGSSVEPRPHLNGFDTQSREMVCVFQGRQRSEGT